MNIIKVDAIASTNTALKDMIKANQLDNFTVLYTNNQTAGRGQVHAKWEAEPFKNLTFSVYIKDLDIDIENQFYLNQVVSIIVSDFIQSKISSKVHVKWPNDILADKKKICGILIENTVSNSKIKHSIIGIGLNVNQEKFNHAPNPTSLKLLNIRDYDLELLLKELLSLFESSLNRLLSSNKQEIHENYLKQLYQYQKPAMYRSNGEQFMGKILGVSRYGKLQLEKEDEKTYEYEIKEIQFL